LNRSKKIDFFKESLIPVIDVTQFFKRYGKMVVDLLHNHKKEKRTVVLSQEYRSRHKRFGLRLNPVRALINFDKSFSLK
jgi:hypothetical protein